MIRPENWYASPFSSENWGHPTVNPYRDHLKPRVHHQPQHPGSSKVGSKLNEARFWKENTRTELAKNNLQILYL